MIRKRVLLIGSQPERMIRLKKTFNSLKEIGIDVRILVPYRKPSGSPRIIKGIIRYLLLALQVALSKADIYHFFNVPDIIGLPLLWKRGTLLYDVRSPWFSSIKETLGNNVLSRIAGLIERIMTMGADVILATNYPLARRAHKWNANDICVIPNYPSTDFAPTKSRETMRTLLHLEDCPTVIYVGKISILEGSELLKRVMFEVSKAISNVRFLIVGDGPEKESLESFIRQHDLTENVLMVGWVDHAEVPNYIVSSDICLLPRNKNSFSPYTSAENVLKAGEYLSMGKPMVVPRIGGFVTATFPVISVQTRDMGIAVIEFFKNAKQQERVEFPSWSISHHRLQRIYTRLGAIIT